MKAIVIGATGATGTHLVDALVEYESYSEVVIFVRKATGKKTAKLTEHVVDLTDTAPYESEIQGDVLFSCLGTTLKAAGSKEAQWKVDYDIPYTFATIASKNKVTSVVLVSTKGASEKSSLFYSKMKGKLEGAIGGLSFEQYLIFRPGALEREGTDRLGEKVTVAILKGLNAIGLLRKYKPLPTQLLAQKLAQSPKELPMGKTIIEMEDITEF